MCYATVPASASSPSSSDHPAASSAGSRRSSEHRDGPPGPGESLNLSEVVVSDGVSLIQTNKNHSAYWPYCRGHALPPNWLKACNPARNGGVDDHHHRVYHGVVL